MMLKVIYTECSCQPWFDVASYLEKHNGWKPVYWTGAEEIRDEVMSRFPNIVFHHNRDAARGIVPLSRLALPALDEKFLQEYAQVESIALRMMDRMEPDESFTFWQRIRLYHNHLRYWSAVLDAFAPEVVVFPSSPHLVYDFVLYALCKQHGVKTVLIKETGVNGLLFVQEELDGTHPVIATRYQELLAQGTQADAVLSDRSADYLARIRGDYKQATPAYLEPFLTDGARPSLLAFRSPPPVQVGTANPAPIVNGGTNGGVNRRINAVIRRAMAVPRALFTLPKKLTLKAQKGIRKCRLVYSIARDLFRRTGLNDAATRDAYASMCYLYDHMDRPQKFIFDPAPPNYLVRFAEEPEDKASMTGIEYRLYRRLATRKKDYLAAYYSKLCRTPDFTKPYVFVALNYQCECSTSPDGGQFVELTLMVRMLSQLIPEGWQLYVKEHPAQFHSRGSGESARTQQFYDDMAALPNVTFVPLTTIPFELIDNARAVATVNGTSGWEAVVRGKPTLLFGHAWFKGCEGIFYTPTSEVCRQAIAKIVAGYTPDYTKVKTFVRAVELCGTMGGTLPEYVETFAVAHEDNVRAFASVLAASAAPICKAA